MRRRAERIADARLFDRGVALPHDEHQRTDAPLLARHELQHPAVVGARLERRREIAVDVPEPPEKRDRRRRLEGLAERRLQHLLLFRLVDPERLAVAHDRLPVGRGVIPAHPVRLLEADRPVRRELARHGRGLDFLAEFRDQGARRFVALLEGAERVGELVGAGRRHDRGGEHQADDPSHRSPAYPSAGRGAIARSTAITARPLSGAVATMANIAR